MSIHFDRVMRRKKLMKEAKLKMSEFKLALDQIDHYTSIEKDALKSLEAAYLQKNAMLARYKSTIRQIKTGMIDEREFKEHKNELKKEIRALNSEMKEMKYIDKRVHKKLKEPIKNFKDSFKSFKRLLRA